jgi:hypothetical protein
MHDRPTVLGRIRDLWEPKAAKPRRELIPEYEMYEPLPSRWEKVRSVGWDDVQFVAFIVMLCLTVPLVLTVVANGTRLDIPWLSTIQIILGVGTALSLAVAYFDQLFMFTGGEGGGGG